MRVTSHSALTISICALALLFQLPSAHSFGGGIFQEGRPIKSTFTKEYVDKYQGNLKLTNVRWGGGDGKELSFARVNWHHHDAFMKCDKASNEVDAFKALDIMKTELKEGRLSKDYAAGQQNVMNPLHRFGFTRNGPVDIDLADFDQLYVCYLYSFIDGVSLVDYLKEYTPIQAFILIAKILPQVTQGLLYIYNAGILHKDVAPRNIMLEKNPTGGTPIVKIIDFDSIDTFEKDVWTRINPNNNEYLLPNPNQRSPTCNYFKTMVTAFFYFFVYLDGSKEFFKEGYVLSESVAVAWLNDFNEYLIAIGLKQSVPGLSPPLPDVKPVIPSMLYLLKAHSTLIFDRYPCSSPMRALKGLPPRTL